MSELKMVSLIGIAAVFLAGMPQDLLMEQVLLYLEGRGNPKSKGSPQPSPIDPKRKISLSRKEKGKHPSRSFCLSRCAPCPEKRKAPLPNLEGHLSTMDDDAVARIKTLDPRCVSECRPRDSWAD
jgi:hypothetical protein